MAHAFIIESRLKDTAGGEQLHPEWDKEYRQWESDRVGDTCPSPERSASGGVCADPTVPVSGKDTLAWATGETDSGISMIPCISLFKHLQLKIINMPENCVWG